MAFMTGFVLVSPEYREGEKREEVKRHLAQLGFEVYEPGVPQYLVYYVEAPTLEDLEALEKMAESHPGVVKVFVSYGFLGDQKKLQEIEEAIAKGELQVDESVLKYVQELIEDLSGKS